MKRKWLGLALCAVLASGATAMADVFATDNAGNYGEDYPFVADSQGGYGFSEWWFQDGDAAPELADSSAGACGNVNSENGFSFRFARDADHDWCHASRGFGELNPGDAFSVKFSCAWDGGGRGIDLYSYDGQIANAVNLGPGNNLTVCGEPAFTDYGGGSVYELVLVQDVDGIDLELTRTPADPDADPDVYQTKIETTAKLSSVGFYAGGWEWDATAVDNYALFVNDLEIVGEEPEDALSLTPPDDDAWQVLSAEEELEFTVSRTHTEGELEVTLASNDPDFVSVPESVTIADGETDATFTATVTLKGYGNVAQITAEAVGVYGANYQLSGPKYRISAVEQVKPGTTTNFWVDWDNNYMRDDSKLSLAIEPEGADFVADGPDDWTWNDKEDGAYVEASYTANESARLVLKFDGVEMWGANVTVVEPTITIEGPTTIRPGQSAEYVVKTYTLESGTTIHMTSSDDSLVSIDPEDYIEVAIPEDENTFTVTSLGDEGNVTLTVTDDVDFTATLDIAIAAPPSYTNYVAYDDAELYCGTFDFASTGTGTEGFGAWQVVQQDAQYGGVVVENGDAGMPSILSADGKAIALYANGGEIPVYSVVRPFVNSLQPGQKATVEFVASEASGSRVVRFVRIDEGGNHNRFEIWNNSGNIGINVDGVETAINWPSGLRRVEASIELAADGSSFTLELLGHNPGSDLLVDDIYQHVVNSNVGYWGGGIQGIFFEGSGSGENFVFNRLSIEQVEEPVAKRSIGWAAGVWNPDAAGEYKFAISATTDDIGEVALSVEPSDGALSLSTDTVDLTGVTETSFAVILSEANAGDSFVITATPADRTVAPIEYNVTVSASYVTLSSDAWEYPVSAGEIWLALSASLSKYGTYAITSSDEAVLAVPELSEAITVGSTDKSWFNVTIVGPGQATIYATAEGEETPAAKYTFTVIADAPVIDGTTIEVSFADGDGISGKVDDTLRDQFTDVRAQVLQWNGVDAFDEVEVLNNEAEWPDMQFTPSIDNPVIRLIFVK